MPVHITPLTRREFVKYSLAAGAGVLTLQSATAAEDRDAKVDPDSFALLSDTHIPAKADFSARGVNMSTNLKKTVVQLAAMKTRPAGAFISGDCAFNTGQAGDYKNLAALLAPLGRAQLPLHMVMGNHDHRQRLYAQFKARQAKAATVKGKHVTVVEAARANWVLLDSLYKTNDPAGVLGEAQLAWLAKALDARKDKPAICVAHHNPFWGDVGKRRVAFLKDTAALFEILAARPHVKAYMYGHTHRWQLTQRNGLHLINLPTMSYLFKKGEPTGWVHAQLRDGGITLRPHCHDPKHAVHGKEFKLTWRADKA